MKPSLTEADIRLIAAYTEAALRMSRELATFRTPEDRFRILQRINAILSQLDQLSADYRGKSSVSALVTPLTEEEVEELLLEPYDIP